MEQLLLNFGLSDKSKDWRRGYETGLTWDANWYVSGPWIYTAPGMNPSEEQKRKEADSRKANEDYKNGFKEGLIAMMEVDEQFAEWWKENIGYRGTDVSRMRFYRETQGNYLPLSSVGRALALQARGRLFEPDRGNQLRGNDDRHNVKDCR